MNVVSDGRYVSCQSLNDVLMASRIQTLFIRVHFATNSDFWDFLAFISLQNSVILLQS